MLFLFLGWKILLILPLRSQLSLLKSECFVIVIRANDDSVKMFIKCSMRSSAERETQKDVSSRELYLKVQTN